MLTHGSDEDVAICSSVRIHTKTTRNKDKSRHKVIQHTEFPFFLPVSDA